MSCNCNNADPNCEPCAICTPPGVTGLTVCKPIDPCDKKLDIACAVYTGDDYPCYGIQNGNSLFSVIFNLFGQYFPECCNINGTIVLPTTTTTSTSTTTSTTSTTSTTTTSTTTTSSTTTTTTTFNCSCTYWDVTNPLNVPITINYTACNNGYQPTSSVFAANSVTRVCSCSDIVNNIPNGVTVNNSGIKCSTQPPISSTTTTTSTTTIPPCKCYNIFANSKSSISWMDCNGVIQTSIYNTANPLYCSPDPSSFIISGFNTITGGTSLCVGGVCPSTTTTSTTSTSTTTTTTLAPVCVPSCETVYLANNKLYYYNLTATTSQQLPNPSTPPVGAYGNTAHTINQFFIIDNVNSPWVTPSTSYAVINIYSISLCPFRFSSTLKTITATAGNNMIGLTAKSTNLLIACRIPTGGGSSVVVEVDTSGTTPVFTTKFSLDTVTTKIITGDLYYSADGYLYVTTRNAANTTRWISKYNYSTGALVTDLSITSITTATTNEATGVAAINNNLYIFLASGAVYRVDNMTTLVQMPWGNIGIASASTAPGCLGFTTTTTTTLACNCLTFTNSGADGTYTYTDCYGVSQLGIIGAGAILNFCGVPGSATFSSGSITSTTGNICYDKKTCVFGTTTTTTTPPTTTTTTVIYTTTTTSSTTSTTTTTTTAAPTTTTTTTVPVTTTTTNLYTNKYAVEQYSCIDPNGCNNPTLTTFIATVQSNTLIVGKYYVPVGAPTNFIYKVRSTSTGTPTIVLNKLSESNTCTLACNYGNIN